MDNDKILDIYTRMLRIRRFEEQVGILFAQGQLPGFVHLYIGEEAIAAGVCAALRDDDYIVSTHRGHGHVIAKGGDFNRMMAELFGKATGYCKGKGGSMHIADFSIGILGACGIVGGGIPLAVGAGLSAAYRGTDQVAVSFFGDGASNEGSFHESLNLAAVMKLPVIFVCENNRYGEFTPMEKVTAVRDIAVRATGYGIPGVIVDGTDALAVYDAAAAAVARARNGEGPTLIEAKTHRRGGHAEGEKAFLAGGVYRSQEELAEAQLKDPLLIMHRRMVAMHLIAPDVLEELDHRITQAVAEAVAFARRSPDPEPEAIYEDTWI
jgi:pyruvate dehydrogenase E1 component alpha subunit